MIFRPLMNDMSSRNIQTSCKQGQIPTGEVTSPTMRATRFPIASVLPSLRHNAIIVCGTCVWYDKSIAQEHSGRRKFLTLIRKYMMEKYILWIVR